jgi:D-3-phosphoglycerate dehydrogenase / 2-oxoglutarate reductase
MRILAVGDSYLGVPTFEQGLARLAGRHELEFLQLDESQRFAPVTDAERALREYAGDPDEIVDRMAGVEVLVVHGAPVTDKVLAASADLELVGCARGGPVNVDVAAAKARGIAVATTPGKNAEAVADQALAFMIMLARRFTTAQRFLLEGGRLAGTFDGAAFFGHDLGGLTAGLVGFGHVGRAVARRTAAFGMRTLVYDPFVRVEDAHAEQVGELAELLARADVVSLHTRATAETESMVDAGFLAAMRPHAYLVNTARESLVDEAALDAALAAGRLAGAALDVVREAAGAPHPLLRHDNVVITPHIGGATYETLLRGATMIAEAIEAFAARRDHATRANT